MAVKLGQNTNTFFNLFKSALMRHLLLMGIMLCLMFSSCSKMELEDDRVIRDLDLNLRTSVHLGFHARRTTFSEFSDPVDTSSSVLWKIWSGIPVEREFDFSMSMTEDGQFDMDISNMRYSSERPEWDNRAGNVDRITHDGVSIRIYGP